MMTSRRRLLGMLPAAAILGTAPRGVWAQSSQYPDRPLRLFVPFGPGSGSDVYARYFGRKLGERLGQGVAVENRPGGGGAVAVQGLQILPADGYAILLGSNSPMAVNVSAVKRLPYDPLVDLTPICGLTRSMAIIAVPGASPIRTIDQLASQGRARSLSMGTYSAGYQLAVAPFLQKAGFKWNAVSYRGLSQTINDLIGGQIDTAVIDSPGTVQQVASGQIHALAVTGSRRHPELPNVPTLAESGYPDAVHYSWTSLWLPAGTPKPIIDTLSGHMLKLLTDPESERFVASTSGEIMPLGPDEMRAFQKREIERFAKAVEALGFEPS